MKGLLKAGTVVSQGQDSVTHVIVIRQPEREAPLYLVTLIQSWSMPEVLLKTGFHCWNELLVDSCHGWYKKSYHWQKHWCSFTLTHFFKATWLEWSLTSPGKAIADQNTSCAWVELQVTDSYKCHPAFAGSLNMPKHFVLKKLIFWKCQLKKKRCGSVTLGERLRKFHSVSVWDAKTGTFGSASEVWKPQRSFFKHLHPEYASLALIPRIKAKVF